jgi:hypothetical protein
MAHFVEARQNGVFGHLPPKQGGSYPRPRKHELDDAEKGVVLGVQLSDWQARRDAISQAWSETEREHRRYWVPTPGRDDMKKLADDMPHWGSEWTVQEISELHFHDS